MRNCRKGAGARSFCLTQRSRRHRVFYVHRGSPSGDGESTETGGGISNEELSEVAEGAGARSFFVSHRGHGDTEFFYVHRGSPNGDGESTETGGGISNEESGVVGSGGEDGCEEFLPHTEVTETQSFLCSQRVA